MTKEELAQRIKDSDYTCKGINCTECISVNGFGCCLQADRKLYVSMILSKNKKSDDKEKLIGEMTEQKCVRTYDNINYNSCVESICSKELNSLLERGWKVVFITPRPTYTEYIIEREIDNSRIE